MSDNANDYTVHIRLAHADDDDFILDLAGRFVETSLPTWRKRAETLAGIERDIEYHLTEQPPASHLFIAENDEGESLGFLHLQTREDFFTGAQSCHISDIAVSAQHEGHGVASAMLRFAESWAKEHRCRFLTLGTFPANERARAVYEHHGFGIERLTMVKLVK